MGHCILFLLYPPSNHTHRLCSAFEILQRCVKTPPAGQRQSHASHSTSSKPCFRCIVRFSSWFFSIQVMGQIPSVKLNLDRCAGQGDISPTEYQCDIEEPTRKKEVRSFNEGETIQLLAFGDKFGFECSFEIKD